MRFLVNLGSFGRFGIYFIVLLCSVVLNQPKINPVSFTLTALFALCASHPQSRNKNYEIVVRRGGMVFWSIAERGGRFGRA